MALAPWFVLAGGKLRSDEEERRRRETGENGRTYSSPNWERSPVEVAASQALEEVAKEVGAKSVSAGMLGTILNGKRSR